MSNITILSNTCIGQSLMSKLIQTEYKNPLISVEIPDQKDFVKITCNLSDYVKGNIELVPPSTETRFAKQNNNNPWIGKSRDYPVLRWNDVYIHMYHNTIENAFPTFKRRLERLKNLLLESDYRVISICSFHEHRCDEENIVKDLIEPYMSVQTKNEIHIYVGPSKYYKETYGDRYIIIKEWDNVPWSRMSCRGYSFGTQTQVIKYAFEVVKKYIDINNF